MKIFQNEHLYGQHVVTHYFTDVPSSLGPTVCLACGCILLLFIAQNLHLCSGMRGPPHTPTPHLEKDAEIRVSRLQRQVAGDKAVAWAGSESCFSQSLGPMSHDTGNTVPLAAAPGITGP